MDLPQITGWFIIITIAVIIAYDIVVLINGGTEATISWIIKELHNKWPLLAPVISFAMGCLWGHFFWQMHP